MTGQANSPLKTGHSTGFMMRSHGSVDKHFDLELKYSSDRDHVLQCQRLRYKVYCVERGWYDEVTFEDGREHDEFDDRSVHALITRLRTGEGVGVVRMILPENNGNGPNLPIQEIDPSPLSLISNHVDFDRMAEISRFAITRDYLKAQVGQSIGQKRQGFSHLSLGLLRAVVLMSRDNNIRYLCATMEYTLLTLFARVGIRFIPLGEPRSYHGIRQPCYCDLNQVKDEMRMLAPEFFSQVFDSNDPF
ncbi:hypothetical protein PB2503_13389 [Parvularcula bermudensis HTCC2503]|uniref:PEP-CTERM/exosortase system-associated acyltransferase n=1 Tax=Parvularcula bermudensis (strain ATCC BAA-594 / HTCC2503 / KCTC 12087) TaxID=314260 RepID=E0TGV6_PARBH|nr:PEP-CTERM/exosortase system-associated acyltransferase [Parvularcula bermudensis]ADM10715.1 hypothetical protein PB2503_13389 [Parvularcula bermudensis HTCC2503]